MKIQLIGAFTKLGPAIAAPLFEAAEDKLAELGHEVFNPCKMITPTMPWMDAMNVTLNNLPKMDAVFVLDNYVISPGSMLEIRDSVINGLKFYNYHYMPPRNPHTKHIDFSGMTRSQRAECIRQNTKRAIENSQNFFEI